MSKNQFTCEIVEVVKFKSSEAYITLR